MEIFELGRIIKDDFGNPIKIIKHLSSGGMFDVYRVEYLERERALYWIKTDKSAYSENHYRNLHHNICIGAPDKTFLWPLELTEKVNDSYGYITELIPGNYCTLGEVFNSGCNFSSFRVACEACIRIASALRILHNNGYCFMALDESNIHTNPQTGDILVNSENIVINGARVDITCNQRYLAPEKVVLDGRFCTSSHTDRHSLAVILFQILFGGHPLEGKKWLVPCMTDSIMKKLYGSEALFVFDLDDESNRPVKVIHKTVLNRWNCMPQYVKDMFLKAFSQKAMKEEPANRPTEFDWINVLARLRSDIVECSCGNEVFIQSATNTKCDVCGKPIIAKNIIELNDYPVTATKGSFLYRCQLGTCDPKDALNTVLLVVAKPDGTLGVKNVTDENISAFTPAGKEKMVHPQEIVPFISGIVINAFDSEIKLTEIKCESGCEIDNQLDSKRT